MKEIKSKKTDIAADAAYLALFILLFIGTAYVVYSEETSFSLAALCVIFAIMIITHFTTITMGLIINIFLIFSTFTWYLYQLMKNGVAIDQTIYFWMILSPVLTIISHLIFRNVKEIEEENIHLKKKVQHFSIVDDETELKNIQAFEMEYPIYERIAKRYKIGLMLMVWEFRYSEDLRKILGEKNLKQTAALLSHSMQEIFRTEDVVYIISKDPYEWGTLMLTQDNSEELLKNRIKEKLEQMDFTAILGKNAPRLEIRIGGYFIDTENESALSVLEKAKKRQQYDV